MTLSNSSEYVVLKYKNKHYRLGYYITKGRIAIFKTYTFSSNMVSTGTGHMYTSLKLIHPTYFKTHKSIGIINKRRYIKALSHYCPEFKEYKKTIKKPTKMESFETALVKFNENCSK